MKKEAVTKTCASNNRPEADWSLVARAISGADLNVLRLALYQLTGDPHLASMRTQRKPLMGGALYTYELGLEHRTYVTEKALAFLQSSRTTSIETPSLAKIRETMELFGQGRLSEEEFHFGYEELALEDFPRDVEWTSRPSDEILKAIHVVVIGAGISGIAASVQLKRLGIPYTVFERLEDIGGTWQLNRYPGAGVDTSSYIYQYKFEKHYPWKECFPSRGETKAYLKSVATKHGVLDSVVLNTEVIGCQWDETTAKWLITTRTGSAEEKTVSANFVISASGLFSTAKTPNIDGAGTFKGRTFHTTAWDEDYDLNGKRIAVIGNGSTGVQLLAGIAEKAAFVSVFQRTPNWIAPLEGYGEHIPETARWMINNFPLYANWLGYANWFITLQLEGVQDYDSKWQESGGKISERNDRLRTTLESYISSKLVGRTELINKLIPKWAPLGRRLAVDNGWYDALKRENVELVTDRIVRMTPSGILTSDGREHNLDLIVFATGFAVARYFFPVQYVGRNGATLDKLWETDGPRAYLGLVLPGFPNLFTFYGPNGQPRAVSFYSWAEIWARYALKAITSVIEAGKTSIECRQDVFERYNTRMDAGSRTSIWEREGKGGYYVTEKGRSLVNMPWRSVDYHAMVVAPRMQDFVLR